MKKSRVRVSLQIFQYLCMNQNVAYFLKLVISGTQRRNSFHFNRKYFCYVFICLDGGGACDADGVIRDAYDEFHGEPYGAGDVIHGAYGADGVIRDAFHENDDDSGHDSHVDENFLCSLISPSLKNNY